MTINVIDLSLINFCDVQVIGTPPAYGVPKVGTACLFSNETPVNGSLGLYGLYKRTSDVVTDWGSSSDAAAIAEAFFSQQPNPVNTGGYLMIVPLAQTGVTYASKTIQSLTFTAKASGTGGNSVTIAYTTGGTQGAEVVTVVGSAISVQIATGVSTAEDIKVAIDDYSAAAALVSVAIASGYELTAQTGAVTATNLAGGSTTAAETIPTAITRIAGQVPYYCGILVDTDYTGSDYTALCSEVQAMDASLFYPSATAADIVPTSVRFDVNRIAGQTHVRALYRTTSFADAILYAAAYAGSALAVDFTGANTVKTMHGKSLIGITPDSGISQAVLNTCKACGADVYQSVGGMAKLLTSGTNQYFDYVFCSLWLKLAMQIAGANYLTQTGTKIPQTEAGMTGLKGAYLQVLKQAVTCGFLAPGTWTSSDTFGNQVDFLRNIEERGYYQYSVPVSQQSVADRADRKAPLVQQAVKTSGAIHSTDVLINVNQ